MAALRASAFIQGDFPPSGRPAMIRRAERLLDAVEPHRFRPRRARASTNWKPKRLMPLSAKAPRIDQRFNPLKPISLRKGA
jgi:hypothetical protein